MLSFSLLSALSLVSALPTGRSIAERGWEFEDVPCESLKIRKEWYIFNSLLPSSISLTEVPSFLCCPFRRSLTLEEKSSYIDAVKCLKSTPPKPNPFDGVRSLFDQYQARLSFLCLSR